MSTAYLKNATRSIVILAGVSAATIPANAEIIAGVGVVCSGWNFSTQTCIDECVLQEGEACDMDISLVYPLGLYITAWNSATIAMLEGVPFQDVDEAPSGETLYEYGQPAELDVTYVVQTTEGHFAKFRFIVLGEFEFPQIEYVYQSDGSRNFVDAVPVERSTWGAVKALYTWR